MTAERLRRPFLLFLLIAAFSCSKAPAPKPPGAPWRVLVSGVWAVQGVPGELLACDASGSACEAVQVGRQLTGSKLLRLRGAVGDLTLDSGTHVELADGAELLLEDAEGHALELRAGGMTLERGLVAAPVEPLRLRLVDRTLDLPAQVTAIARVTGPDRAELSVSRGRLSVHGSGGVEGQGSSLFAGQGVSLQRKSLPDLRAAFAGSLAQLRQSVGVAPVSAAPPVGEPRGLGTMTARVPGSPTVVSGVRLTRHHVRAVVADGLAQTEVEETFLNETSRVLEGRYVFPLPADASISGLTLWVGDTPVEGEVVERKRAAAIFKGIVEDTVRPRDPALLEWVSGSTFSLKVFPIPARGSRKVLIRYQQVLTADGPRQTYSYPLSLGAQRSTRIDDFSIDVAVSDAGGPASGVAVAGYAAKVHAEAARTRVVYQAFGSAPDRDFTLSFERKSASALGALTDQGFVAVRLRAELPADLPVPEFQRRDRVLVLDASYSQSPESLQSQVTLALGLVRNLEPDERFALLVCDSACESSPPSGLAPATDAAIGAATAWLKGRKPSGSSDLAGALIAAARRVAPGSAAQVVYLGDGAPTAGELSLPSVVRRVRPSFAARTLDLRLLGVGPSIDEVVLLGLARELSGSYDRVASQGPVSEQIERVGFDLRRPLLLAPRLELPLTMSQVQPSVLPNLRLGQEFWVVGKLQNPGPFSISLRGQLAGKAYALARSVTLASGSVAGNRLAPRLWAEARIRELDASNEPSQVSEVLELSKRFRVMSRRTSWLVLENEQMFAEFGIPRTAAPGAQPEPGLESELQELQGGTTGGARGAGRSESDAKSSEAPSASLDAASPGAPAEESLETSPSPKPASAPPSPAKSSPAAGSGSGLADLGGTGAPSKPSASEFPRGQVQLGAVTSSGGSVANASRVLAGLRGRFRSCYERGLRENPNAGGRVGFSLRLTPEGQVATAALRPSGELPPVSLNCLKASASAARFEPAPGGQVTVLFSLVLRPDATSGGPEPRPGPLLRAAPPADIATHRAGDDAWLSQGQDAIAKLRSELEASPQSRKRHEALIRGLLVRGRFSDALQAARRFVALDPDLALSGELLAYAAVASGDRLLATATVDALAESAPLLLKVQARAARAFEALGDEARACAHWRAVVELAPQSDEALFESLRCRARVLDERDAALQEAKSVQKPGSLLQKLLPLLESGRPPVFEKSSGGLGQFEASLSCEPRSECPYVIVVTPTGTVFSPWTPALGRSSATSFAFSGLLSGTYRSLLVGGATGARGELELRCLAARSVFPFGPNHAQTLVATQVTLADRSSRFDRRGGLGALLF